MATIRLFRVMIAALRKITVRSYFVETKSIKTVQWNFRMEYLQAVYNDACTYQPLVNIAALTLVTTGIMAAFGSSYKVTGYIINSTKVNPGDVFVTPCITQLFILTTLVSPFVLPVGPQ